MKFGTPNQQEAAARGKGRRTAAEKIVILRKAALSAAAAALLAASFISGSVHAQSAGSTPAAVGEIPAVPASVMSNARKLAGPHPDANPVASAMGLRPERRAAASDAVRQVDSGDAVGSGSVKTSAERAESDKKSETDSPGNTVQREPAKSVIIRSPRVNVLPGVNVVIPIARSQPNRLLTPFKHPQVLSTDLQGGQGDNCGEACVRGSVLYVSTDQAKPVTAFITEKGREDIAISVTMIPERIAPRQVEFLLPKSVMEKLSISDVGAVEGSSTQARRWEQSQPYIDTIKESFKAIALGQVPQGYSLRNVRSSDKLPVCRQWGLNFTFRKGQVLEGHNLMVYVGVVRNVGSSPIEFNEMHCGGWNVAAVTSFPLKVLDKGDQTEVYVALKREATPAAGTVRRPLIDRKF